MISAYVIMRLDPDGPVARMSSMETWDHLGKDTLYAMQEMLGDGAAVRLFIMSQTVIRLYRA